jgi:anti-anti-sigma factor
MSDELYTEVRLLPQASVIDLAGDVTSFADTRLHSSFNDASASGKTHIILNFARVDYINSAGIATIISILAEARQRAQQLLIVGLNDHYRKIFRMVGVARYAEIYENEQDALEKLNGAL